MSLITRRLLKELQDLKKIESTDIQLAPVNDDLFNWTATLSQIDVPYQNTSFTILIQVPENYPTVPPKIKFKSKICHPNIHFLTGEICLDLLSTQWAPTWTLYSTCVAIKLLLTDPVPDSPLNCDAANLLRIGDIRGYHSLVGYYQNNE
ncbi:ubiquitin-conjugating enzyme family protein [Globomyces pollinis-pini]|nr:ubiquitin-conjugating enzyme family protein [Globomyces pollinis-pini]